MSEYLLQREEGGDSLTVSRASTRSRASTWSAAWSERSRLSTVSSRRRQAMGVQAERLVESRQRVTPGAKQQSTQSYAADFVNNTRDAKHVQSYLRWSIIWTVVFVLLAIPLPYYLIPLSCKAGTIYVLVVQMWGAVVITCVHTSGITVGDATSSCRRWSLKQVMP